MFPLVGVVETRGIEPLTPASQTHSETPPDPDRAGRCDLAAGGVVSDGCRRRELDATLAAIVSDVEDRDFRIGAATGSVGPLTASG